MFSFSYRALSQCLRRLNKSIVTIVSVTSFSFSYGALSQCLRRLNKSIVTVVSVTSFSFSYGALSQCLHRTNKSTVTVVSVTSLQACLCSRGPAARGSASVSAEHAGQLGCNLSFMLLIVVLALPQLRCGSKCEAYLRATSDKHAEQNSFITAKPQLALHM